ncbi:MAG: hypothetical protein PVI57_07155 [Gemmatimonadota bacterium]|jgi:hypothetical protein
MIELRNDTLVFSFPEVHREARLRLDFQRTLRIPDDGEDYPLPPGLGSFPLRHVDDFAARVPEAWIRHGGVMLPMYQSEAMWLDFTGDYPMAVKVAAGKIDAVTGEAWDDGIHRDPQDYLVVPDQPWLDGYCIEKGAIRQFVAMPLGSGYSAEEQLTGRAEHGGVQIVVHPMKAEAWMRMRREPADVMELPMPLYEAAPAALDMGLAPGGRMRQEIYDDPHDFDVWDTRHRSRCFVHLANSLAWRTVTGENPPSTPVTAEAYTRMGYPWFEYFDAERKALQGSDVLARLRSVAERGRDRGEVPLPENASVQVDRVVTLRKGLREGQVREGRF